MGLLTDAALRVAAAFTLPPDVVPALGLALSLVTLVVLNVVTCAYYVACGTYDPRSPMRRPLLEEQGRLAEPEVTPPPAR